MRRSGDTAGVGLRRAVVAFRIRDFRYFFVSGFASQLGMQMSMIAQGILAWELTGSFAVTGVLGLSFGIPMLFLSLIGGATADRFGKRTLVMASQATNTSVAVATGLLVATNAINVPLLFVLGLVQGCTFPFMMPARQALLAEIVPRAQLMNAVALNTASRSGTTIVGPAVAGLMIGFRDVETAYFLLAAVNMVSLLTFTRVHSGRTVEAVRRRGGGTVADVLTGLRYVVRSPVFRMLMFMAALHAFFGMPYQVLLPGFASEELGQQSAYATIVAVAGAGALAGALVMALLSEYERKPLLQLIVGLGMALSLVGLGVGAKEFGLASVLFAAIWLGFSLNTFQALNNTMILSAADPAYTGRVMSMVMFTFSVMPLVGAPLGVVADLIGASTVFIVMGATAAACLLGMLVVNRKQMLGPSPDVVYATATERPELKPQQAANG
ncbi:MAG TPA: MFS transporter [Dehalococcoidia bacterium]|nr:MFS transporter [Dehalococcoidia bacterium]